MTRWIVSNCESCGSMHDKCQDRTAYLQNDEVTVVALSDGVSSNALSDKGADLVTSIVCEEIASNFRKYYNEELTKQDFVNTVQTRVKDNCSVISQEYHQMKCTLLFCAINNDQYLIGHIGDGAILYFGDKTRVISQPQQNSLGGTATYTILDYNAGENIVFQMGTTNNCDGFLLTSDGLLGNVYYSGGSEVPQLAYDLFSGVVSHFELDTPKDERDSEYRGFLYENIQKDNKLSDDCSLAIISREEYTGLVNYDITNGFEPDIKWPCLCGQMNDIDEIRCSKCRRMCFEIYPDTIIRIISKEGFFSRLDVWIHSDDKKLFNPGDSATIVNEEKYNSLCQQLKQACDTFDEDKKQRTIDADPKQSESNKKTSSEASTDASESYSNSFEASHVLNSIIKKGKKVIYQGIKRFVTEVIETDKSERKVIAKQQEEGIIVKIKYREMLEAAYCMKRIPIEFLLDEERIKMSSEKRDVVDVMYTATKYIDYCNLIGRDIEIVRIYAVEKKIIIIEKSYEDDYCYEALIIKVDSVDEVIRDFDFSDNYKSEVKHIPTTETVPGMTLNWRWKDSIDNARRDARMLRKSLCNELSKIKENKFSRLINSEKNTWLIGHNKGVVDFLALMLVDEMLFTVKPVSDEQILIQFVDISRASEAVSLFYKRYLFVENCGK